MGKVSQLKWEKNGLLIKEEKMWRQRSRTLWLHEGDQNTCFIHNQASHRYRRNQIEELQNSRGEMCKDEEDIAQILITHYQELFHSANPKNFEHVLSTIPTMVTLELNNMLSAEFVKEEVDEALKQMDPLKHLDQMGFLHSSSKIFDRLLGRKYHKWSSLVLNQVPSHPL